MAYISFGESVIRAILLSQSFCSEMEVSELIHGNFDFLIHFRILRN